MFTFLYFDTFDGFVVNGAGAFLEELVPLDTDIEHFRALDAKINQLLDHLVHNICRSLQPR